MRIWIKLWQKLKHLYRHKSSTLAINFTKLFCGTAGGQVVGFITLPILTRMYTVEDYGTQALYLSVASLLAIFVTGQYDRAILLPEEDTDSFALVILTILLATVGCLLTEVAVYTIIHAQSYKEIYFPLSKEICSWLPFLALTIFVNTNFQIWYTWLNRNRAYSAMASMGVISNIFNFLAAFIYGFLTNADSHGLLLNTFFGSLICTLCIIRYCHQKKILPIKDLSYNRLKGVMRRYQQYPRYIIFSGAIENGSNQLPIILMNMLGGAYLTGLYSMIYKLMHIPISLVGSAMGNVFIREASESWQKYNNCHSIYSRILKYMVVIGIVPFGILLFGGPYLIPLFLGAKWVEVTNYIIYLCPMFYMQFISSPLSSVFFIAGKLKADLLISIARFSLVYVSITGSFYLFGTTNALFYSLGVFFVIFYSCQLLLTYKWSKGENFFN